MFLSEHHKGLYQDIRRYGTQNRYISIRILPIEVGAVAEGFRQRRLVKRHSRGEKRRGRKGLLEKPKGVAK